MSLKTLCKYHTYIEIIAAPCFYKMKFEASHLDTMGRYILVEDDRYYCETNLIHLGAWDTENNFYIFIKGVMYKTQQKYFELVLTVQEEQPMAGSLVL